MNIFMVAVASFPSRNLFQLLLQFTFFCEPEEKFQILLVELNHATVKKATQL